MTRVWLDMVWKVIIAKNWYSLVARQQISSFSQNVANPVATLIVSFQFGDNYTMAMYMELFKLVGLQMVHLGHCPLGDSAMSYIYIHTQTTECTFCKGR